MRAKEMSSRASAWPKMKPVSCCGNRPLGIVDIKPARQDRQRNGRGERDGWWASTQRKAAIVDAQHGVEGILAHLVERPRFCAGPAGRRKCAHITGVRVSETKADMSTAAVTVDGEFAEQPPDHAAHEQQRDEHGDQREADREDGEADLARALQRRLERASSPSSM